MDVWCSGCGVKYTFDPVKVPAEGVNVRCTRCNAVFRVDAPEPGNPSTTNITTSTRSTPPTRRPQTTPPSRVAAPRMRGTPQDPLWTVRHRDGTTLQFRDMTTLQKWVVEQKVSREDEFSQDGQNWSSLGDMSELESFFTIVDAANSRGYFGSQPHVSAGSDAPTASASPYDTSPLASDLTLSLPSESRSETNEHGLELGADSTSPMSLAAMDLGADATQPMSLSELAASYGADSGSDAHSVPANPAAPPEDGRSGRTSSAVALGGAGARLGGASDSGSFWATELNPATQTGEMRPFEDDTLAHWQNRGKTARRWGWGAVSSVLIGAAAWWFWPTVAPAGLEGTSASEAVVPAPSAATDAVRAAVTTTTEDAASVPAEAATSPDGPASAGAISAPPVQPAPLGRAPTSTADSPTARMEAKPEPVRALAVAETASAPSARPSLPAVSRPPIGEPAAPVPAVPEKGAPQAPAPTNDVETLLLRAERLRESDRTLDALSLYQQAKELRPDAPRALAGMGWCYIDLERFEEATRAFAQAVRQHPSDAESHFGLAEASKASGDIVQAKASYEKYLEISPRGPDARIARLALEELAKAP